MIEDGVPKRSSSDRDAQARVAQIIAGALMSGSLFFVAITVFMRINGKEGLFAPEPWNVLPPKGMISLIALVVALMVTVVSFVVPQVNVATMRKTMAKQPSEKVEGRFDQVYVTSMIIGIAMLEGGAFFNGIAYMLEGHIPNLLAAVVLIALIAARFPSRDKIDSFAEVQETLLMEERQAA